MNAKVILKKLTSRYDKAKRNLQFSDADFAKSIGYTKEYFSKHNKENFVNSTIIMLDKIHKALEEKGY